MSRELPVNPSLEFLRKEAKARLQQIRQADATMKLADAQHALARDYGFASWPKLRVHVEALEQKLEPAEILMGAVCSSNAAKTARVLERHPELKDRLNEPLAKEGVDTPLLEAVMRSDRKTIDVLLDAGADIRARSRLWCGGMGVMDECAPAMAQFLIDRGAVVDAHAAARLAMPDTLARLIASDPGVIRARGALGQTPLHFASTIEAARLLVEHGAEIDAPDLLHESTPAQHMLRVVQARHYRKDRQDVARYLAAQGAKTDIFMAAALGDIALVRRHLENDTESIRVRVSEEYFPKRDPRSSGTVYLPLFGRNRTPHQVARDFGHREVLELLIRNSPPDVILAQALELGDERIFHAYLSNRPGGATSLTAEELRRLPDAAQNNNLDAVKLMLAAGWPVNAPGEYDMPALHWAAWHGNAPMVREILRYRPQLELSCQHRITALGSVLHGSMNGWHRDTGDYVATIEALLDAGAKAPKVTEDLEASEPVREVLRRRETTAG